VPIQDALAVSPLRELVAASFLGSPDPDSVRGALGVAQVDSLNKGKYYVTVPGGEALRRELEALERKRGEVAGNIRTAKAFGDLSENFEYHEAKREQGFVEGRILQLKMIVPELEEVTPEEVSTDEVGFGSLVTLIEPTGDEWDVTIVGPLEADPAEDRISYESPLGSALIGHKAGETISAEVPAGTVTYQIKAIRPYEF
jgi:transcription elongation factor GreA